MNEIFRFHHEDGEHTHPHEHGHSHSHEGCDPHDCAACGSCDPMQVLTAVSEFEKGNLRLSTVLASLK